MRSLLRIVSAGTLAGALALAPIGDALAANGTLTIGKPTAKKAEKIVAQVLEVHYELKAPRDVATGQASSKKVNASLRLKLVLDESSPLLWERVATNLEFSAELVVAGKGGAYTIKLAKATMASYEIDTAATGATSVTIVLSFDKMLYNVGGITVGDPSVEK